MSGEREMAGTGQGVVVLGSLHLDIMVEAPDRPRKGETLVGKAWGTKFGGKGGNQAVAAARHGAATAMVGAVGQDDFGDRLLAGLTGAGVDTTHVARVPGVGSGMSVAIVDEEGDYGAVIVSGSNLTLDAAAVTQAGSLLAAAGCLVLQNEVPEAANGAAARLARAAGCTVIHNAAPARPYAEEWPVDVLVVNAIEAEMLSGRAVTTLEDAEAAGQLLLGRSPAVVVTAGGAGLVLVTRDAAPLRHAAHAVTLVSTHGAGDMFVGALVARLAAGEALPGALAYANAAAALHVSTPPGATPRGPAEVKALLGAAAG